MSDDGEAMSWVRRHWPIIMFGLGLVVTAVTLYTQVERLAVDVTENRRARDEQSRTNVRHEAGLERTGERVNELQRNVEQESLAQERRWREQRAVNAESLRALGRIQGALGVRPND